MNQNFEERLTGGKTFSLGNTVEVVQTVLESPETFSEYLELFSSENSQVVMRASNGLKRIFDERLQWFSDFKSSVIPLLHQCPHDSARWTLVQLLKKYKNQLSEDELSFAFTVAEQFTLESQEWITLAQSMDLLIKLKKRLDPSPELRNRVAELADDSRKAVAGKAKKLLEVLP
ncbi:MAG: hypothetical protein F6K21_17615 [Symploca sp. SIO2D2]|nr:hypothetical protein [Symploca sp. SIO2D2]